MPVLTSEQKARQQIDERLHAAGWQVQNRKAQSRIQDPVNLRRAERLRQSILKCAFKCRLVPQGPNDEPASVLLERIAMERKAGKGKGGERKT